MKSIFTGKWWQKPEAVAGAAARDNKQSIADVCPHAAYPWVAYRKRQLWIEGYLRREDELCGTDNE